MEQPTIDNWKVRLERLLNHSQFASSNEQERLEVLQEALRQSTLSIQDFNYIITELWHQIKPVPQLFGNRLVYLAAKRPYVNSRETFIYRGSPDELEDKHLLDDIEKFIWEEFNYDAEPLLIPLKQLIKEIQATIDQWARGPPTRIVDRIEKVASWKSKFMIVVRLIKRNRQCRNSDDPWDATPIAEVTESEYLHLSNGMCWNIYSFMEYVRGVNGANDSSGLVDYSSEHLWETEDLERILQHPAVKANGFDMWLKNILSASSYSHVSFETLDQLYRLASIFVSRGNPFHKQLQKELSPQLYKAYWQYTKGNSDDVHLIPISQGQEIIRDTIKNKMKLDAFDVFMRHYESLSKEEKDALELLYPGFERDLTFCDAGRLCVYVLAKTLITLYKRLAELKGIEPLQLDITER